jgi:hypothetical protein
VATNFRKYFPIAIFAVILISVLLVGSKIRKAPPEVSITPTPSPFGLIRVFPPQENQEFLNDTKMALQFTFSRPVDTTTTVVTIKPTIAFRLSADFSGNTLYISPIDDWETSVEYKVAIEARSRDNEVTTSPIEYSFRITPQKDSALTE